MAIKIGITGGIGSGKSTVSQILEIMGIPIYNSDTEAKRLIHTDPTIQQALCKLTGNTLFQNGELNRTLLAAYMFGKPTHIHKVNQIIHPNVKKDFQQWESRFPTDKIIGIESAILLEAGFKKEVDIVVMVYAPIELRIERTIKRDHSTKEKVMERINSQMNDEIKSEQSDFIIQNDEKTPLIPQVLKLISSLSKNNHYLCLQE